MDPSLWQKHIHLMKKICQIEEKIRQNDHHRDHFLFLRTTAYLDRLNDKERRDFEIEEEYVHASSRFEYERNHELMKLQKSCIKFNQKTHYCHFPKHLRIRKAYKDTLQNVD
uniref:Uncharacterized protein n=1 Tax=Percolomonas cosmopolitus TaxID=63605 RepID=A0A7S1PHS9_9EUKA|mmetsp:Transcript_6254/g.23523  ORF Transcript_6254/g.23523 Transcript_6254/m.23523 type:complete len:112 (+) Transcript_6254:166-501(+)